MRPPTLSLLCCLSVSLAAAPPPNILLICVDDLKPTIGCFGDPHARTPNIDRLAGRGVRFLSSYVQQAVCAPSRNSLMTGLRPDQMGVYDLATWFRHGARDAVTLSQRFIQAGYHAESLGKVYHRGHGNIIDPASWSVRFWYPSGGSPAAVTTGGPKPPTGAEVRPRLQENGRPRGPAWGWPDVPDSEFSDGKIARHAVERLDTLSRSGQPFFLGVGFARPHLPFVAPSRYWDLFDASTLPVPPIGYYASTAFVDAQIGGVLEALDRLGVWRNTIVALWGDHGWHLGDHGLWCKHTNFEQATRNPLIIAAPGKLDGVATEALVQSVDVYPTLCDLAGLKPPPGLAGTSLVPLLDDVTARVQDAVFQVYPRGSPSGGMLGRAVRTDRYRYVEWREWKSGAVRGRELYDYQLDSAETENLADQREHADLIRNLAERLAALGPARPPVVKDPTLAEPAGAR